LIEEEFQQFVKHPIRNMPKDDLKKYKKPAKKIEEEIKEPQEIS
jgi:predicted nucleotidyltransferase